MAAMGAATIQNASKRVVRIMGRRLRWLVAIRL
jgi:hypothetical protein